MGDTPRTSASDPLRIDGVTLTGGAGCIGMTLCPGKSQARAISGAWERDLAADLAAITDWGAVALISLLEEPEFVALGVTDLPEAARAAGLAWHPLPIPDGDPPGKLFEFGWLDAGEALLALLGEGGRLAVHCRGGLGRTGTVAARLLIESGEPAWSAINRVREARPGAIETAAQERYLLSLVPGH